MVGLLFAGGNAGGIGHARALREAFHNAFIGV
jgi:hypothetical protein